MKKLRTLALAGIMSISLAACGGPAETAGINQGATPPISPQLSDQDITGEINISCFDTMTYQRYLEEAASAFEAKYPGTKVNITGFSAMPEVRTMEGEDGQKMSVMVAKAPDASSKNDYISKISTELMSGHGPDILAMDILPYYKYVGSGQLEDLKPYMAADEAFSPSDYHQNILDAVQYKGGQYFIPMDYSYDYLSYDTALMAPEAQKALEQASTFTYDKLVEIGGASFEAQKDSPDSAKLFNLFDGIENGPNMFDALFNENYSHFLDFENKAVNFDDGQFASILEKTKEYADKGYINASINPEEMRANMEGTIGQLRPGQKPDAAMFPKYFYQNNPSMMLFQQYNDPENSEMVAFRNIGSGDTENHEVAGLMQDSQGHIPFEFYQAYGINANSENKATAWAFIKFLLSGDMQTSMNLMGRPLNLAADQEKAKLEVSGQLYRPVFRSDENGGSNRPTEEPTGELTEKQQATYEAYHGALEQFAGQLNQYNIKDSTIDNMIQSEIAYFFDGVKTADEVAKALQSRVELYMNE